MQKVRAAVEELLSSRWKKVRRLTFLAVYIIVSYVFYAKYEGWDFFDITYFGIVTISTVGYGSPVPTDDNSRLFTIFFIFFGVAVIFSAFSSMAGEGLSSLERYFCKKKRVANKYQIDDLHHKKLLYLAVLYIFIVLTVGAIFFKYNQHWTWIQSYYYAVETSTSVGYGDLATSRSTRIFLIFYIAVSIIFVSYAIGTFGSVIEHERLLKERKQLLKQMQSLDFIADLNEGKGVAKHEFVLAILTHLGVLNAENDVEPWMKKFEEFDSDNSGLLTKDELANFFAQEVEESEQELQHMAERKKASALTELIDESRMSTMGLVESVIPFHFRHHHNGAEGGAGDEEGRGSNRFSMSFFRGSSAAGANAHTNRLSSVASTGSRGGGNYSGEGTGRGTIVSPSTKNPVRNVAHPPRGSNNAIKTPPIKQNTSSGDLEKGGGGGSNVGIELK